MRHAGRLALLVALWLLAWGNLSVGNLVSGVAVGIVLLAAFPPLPDGRDRVRVRPLGALRVVAYVGEQLLVANLGMTREILRRRPGGRPGVLAHRLAEPSEEVVTIMTSVISLSPGTMTVDVDDASSTVYVHVFRLDDPAAAHAGLARLERLAAGAIGVRGR